MRILMLNANLAGCGTYHRALWFARVCALHGHEATVCTVSPTASWHRATHMAHGIRITEGPRWGFSFLPGHGSNWLDIAWRWREIRHGDCDVVYAFEYHPNVSWPVRLGIQPHQTLLSDWCDWYAGAANVFRGVRMLHVLDQWREEAIRLRAARVSVISSALNARALGIGIPPCRVHLIREGVDTAHMQPHDQAAARGVLGIPTDARVVATLNDGHSFPLLAEAFAISRRSVPRAKLLFVGAPSASQHALVARIGIADAFAFTGRCSDDELPRFLAAADVFALPLADTLANRARFPHKIGDYLACGRATLLSRVGDYPELLREADAAIVADSISMFQNELTALLEQPDRCKYYGDKGRAWVVRSLDWSVLAPSILAFVEGGNASTPPPLTST